jgi:hypothetical protein
MGYLQAARELRFRFSGEMQGITKLIEGQGIFDKNFIHFLSHFCHKYANPMNPNP